MPPPPRARLSCRVLTTLFLAAGCTFVACDRQEPVGDSVISEAPRKERDTSASSNTPSLRGTHLAPSESRPGGGVSDLPDAQDLMRKVAHLDSITVGRDQAKEADQMVANLGKRALWQWIDALTATAQSKGRDVLMAAVFKRLVEFDPELAMRSALDLPDSKGKNLIYSRTARAWAARDFHGLFAFAGELAPNDAQYTLGYWAVDAWAKENSMEAFNELLAKPDFEGGRFLAIPIKRVAEKNIDQALEMLDRIEPEKAWRSAAGGFFDVLVEKDFARAEDWFFSQTETDVTRAFAYSFGSHSDAVPEEAIRIMNQIGDYSTADHFFHGLIHKLRGRGEAFLELLPLVEQIADSGAREATAHSVGGEAARINSTAAIEWVKNLPAGETRLRGYQGIGGSLAANPKEAQAWLSSIPPGLERRYAVFGFAWELAGKDPALAAAWALTVRDSDSYGLLVRKILWQWDRVDTASASAWAAANGQLSGLPSRQ